MSERAASMAATGKPDIIRNLRRGAMPSFDKAVALASTLGVSVEWLAIGQEGGHVPVPVPTPLGLDEFAMVPVYDARVSAGPGALNDPNPEPLHYDAFRLDWLHRRTNSVNRLAVLKVAGDSMWDTLYDGDRVLVDMAVTGCTRDGLYVIRYRDQDETMVKRLSREPNTRLLTVKSDNPRYPTWTGVADDALAIGGRVIWLGRNIG